MKNWKALHKENTDYKDASKAEMVEAFKGDICYISDRLSYDRVFRSHWLFRNAFAAEISEIVT